MSMMIQYCNPCALQKIEYLDLMGEISRLYGSFQVSTDMPNVETTYFCTQECEHGSDNHAPVVQYQHFRIEPADSKYAKVIRPTPLPMTILRPLLA